MLLGNLIKLKNAFGSRWLHLKRREVYQQCFRILGVHESVDQDTVRQAYLELVKRVHPDADTNEASSERFQQVDEAFRMLQEKFARVRRNISENEEEAVDFDIKHTVPQHRQYLSNDGIGVGTPFQRQKQYHQVRAMKAQERVLEHRIEKAKATAGAEETSLMCKEVGGVKYGIERVVEDLIQEAMSKGEFDNLNGAGKPLSKSQIQSPYLDFTTHKLNKIMIDNGFTPEWITLSRDIREAVNNLKNEIRTERRFYGDWPLTSKDQQESWKFFVQLHLEKVQQINKLIDKYNLIVPILENQFFRLCMNKLAERIFKEPNLPRNLSRPQLTSKAKNEGTTNDGNYMANIFSFLGSLTH